nr:MAG TPA: hypothetical protein [Caudoviricetes sp.]
MKSSFTKKGGIVYQKGGYRCDIVYQRFPYFIGIF